MRSWLLILVGSLCTALSLWACGDSSLAACSNEPDVSGAWRFQLSPSAGDAGVPNTISDSFEISAQLEQAGATDFLGIGRFVYGRLASNDPRYFTSLDIPRLLKNDGSKSGAILGCTLSLNVPIASPVTDDNMPQGPLRISLVGRVTAPGKLLGIEGSRLILESESSGTVRDFTWVGER